MGLITTPGKFLVQPQYPAQIDRSTSIGNKLRFAVIGSNQPIDLCNGTQSGGAVGTVIPTPKGIAYLPATTATTWARRIPDIDPVVSGNFTVNWYGYVRTNVQSTLLQSSDGSHGWQLYLAPNAVGSSWLYLYSLQAASGRAFALTVPDNSLHSIALTWDDAAGNIEGFLDGKSLGTNWWIKDTTAQGAAQTLSMLDGSGGGSPQNLLTEQAYKGKLTNVEIAALANNPWLPFKAPDDEIWIIASGGAAALAGTPQSIASATAALSTQIILAGASQAQATSTGSLAAQIALAGNSVSISAASGALTAQIKLSGAALAQAISTAALSTGINISASAVAVASASGMLDTVIKLIASAQAVASATGDLTTGGAGSLSSNAQASATATGVLTAQIRLNAASVAQAIAVAGLSTNITLASGAQSTASASGVITTSIQLSSAAVARAIATGALTIQSGLSASAVAQATATGTLLASAGLPVPTVRTLAVDIESRIVALAGETRIKLIVADNRNLSA